MIDVLTACAAGAPPSPDVVGDPESETPQGVSHCFIAVHVDTAGSREMYQRSLSELVARVHAAPRASWAESFLAPGEPEARVSAERRELIPLSPASVAALRDVGSRSGWVPAAMTRVLRICSSRGARRLVPRG